MGDVVGLAPPPEDLVPPCPEGTPASLALQWRDQHLAIAPTILGPLDEGEKELWVGWIRQLVDARSAVTAPDLRRLRTLLATARLLRALGACAGVPAAEDPARASLERLQTGAIAIFRSIVADLGLEAGPPDESTDPVG